MDQACAVWGKLFAPFQCFHAHKEAVKEVEEEMEDGEGAKGEEVVTETSTATTLPPLTTTTTALARALG